MSQIARLRWVLWAAIALVGLGIVSLLVIMVTVPVTEDADEAAVETPVEEPIETPSEQPAEKPIEKLAAKPAEKPAEKPTEKPVEKPADKPAEKPADKPIEKRAEKTAEKPTKKPAEKLAEGLPAFEEVVFETRKPHSFLSPEELQPLLEPVGAPFRLSPVERAGVKFQGLARIRGWNQNSLLRWFAVDGGHGLRIHLWGQKQGVTLRMHPQGNDLAAYRTLAEPGQGAVTEYGELLATDDVRNARLIQGACHVGYHDGAVVVSRGTVQLLRAALEGPVKAVYIESPGEVVLHDLALLRCGPAPEESPREHRLILDGARPADLPWKENLPDGARLVRRDDGSVELSAEKVPRLVLATLPVAAPGLYSVTFRVEDSTPGSGIGLFTESGELIDGVEYSRGPKSKLCFGDYNWGAEERRPMPYAGPGQWFRLVVAAGMCRCWISSDGVQWGAIFEPRPKVGAWRDVELFLRPNVDPQKPGDAPKPEDTPRRIRLGRLEVRELDGLTGSVSEDVCRKAAAVDVLLKPNESAEAWAARVAGLVPAGCSPSEWRTACALRVLASPVPVDVAAVLLDRAVTERLAHLPSLQARIRLLQDAALVHVIRRRDEDVTWQLEHWERLGWAVLQTGTEAEVQQYFKARMETSIAGGLMSPSLANERLRLLYAEQRWEELKRFQKLLNLWSSLNAGARHTVVDGSLFDWIHSRIEERGIFGRQPLAVPVSRSATGLFQNLRSALQDKQYKEAARLLVNSYALRDEGLIATPEDEQLFISYRGMQQILLRRRELAEAMGSRLDSAAQLGIEQTLTQGDPAAVESLTIQYYGTPAHASACQWLGDRALAAADFTQALSWYAEGRLTASAQQQPDLAARVRLASAMLGNPQGSPPTQPVSFGESRVSPEQFERRVRDAAQQQARAETASPVDKFPLLRAAQPAELQLTSWGELEGDYRDWSSGPIRAVVCEDLVLVNNSRRVVAVESSGGKTRWSWELGKSMSLCPIRPLVQGPRIYLRTMVSPGKYGVACLDKKTGRALWRRDCEDEVAGDPHLVQGRLYVMTVGPPTGAGNQFCSTLFLVELDAESGAVMSRRQVGGVNRAANGWSAIDRASEYQSLWVRDRLILLYSGAVMCLDLLGRVQWLRNSVAIPPEIGSPVQSPSQSYPHTRFCQPPLECGGRIYLQQPGNCAVECLLPETGEVVWRRGVIGLQQILDLNSDRVLVRSASGLTALHTETGRVLWRCDLPGMLAAFARTTGGQILCARQLGQGDKPQLAWLWIDATTGEIKAHSLLPLKNRETLVLGPIVAQGDRVWCCHGVGQEKEPKADGNTMRVFMMQTAGPALEGDVP